MDKTEKREKRKLIRDEESIEEIDSSKLKKFGIAIGVVVVVLLIGVTILFIVETRETGIIFYNAKIYGNEDANSFYVVNSVILNVGKKKDLFDVYRRAKRVDLGGNFVMSGFIDSHAHLLSLGLSLNSVNLMGTRSIDEIRNRITDFMVNRNIEKDTWVVGRGWDQNLWNGPDTPFPNRTDLDSSFLDNPIMLTRIDGHAIWVNSKALQGVQIPDKDPEGGKIIRNSDGVPTGIFIDNAIDIVRSVIPPKTDAEKRDALKLAVEECLKYGITTIHDAGMDINTVDVVKSMAEDNDLNLRLNIMVEGSERDALNYWCAREKLYFYKDRITIGSVKLYIDGALGSRGAALIEEYSDDPGNYGILMSNETTFADTVHAWATCEYQVATHAIGDRGNRVVLDSYERVFAEGLMTQESRYRIEHAQIIEPSDFKRFSDMGIIASMQPTHATSDMVYAEDRLGPKRILGAYAWRTFINEGVSLPLGSDFPVEKVNPILGVYAAVTRKNTAGLPAKGWYANQTLTMTETLDGFTSTAAYAAFSEDNLGSISEGKYADFIILSSNIQEAKGLEILDVVVRRTYFGGKLVYTIDPDDL